MARHVRNGDLVMITSGSLKGQSGTIMRIDTKNDRVFIKGLNLRTKNLKPTRTSPQGGVTTREAGIHISNVSPMVDGKPTRVRFQTKSDGTKLRIAAVNGEQIGEALRSSDAKKHVSAERRAAAAPTRKKMRRSAGAKTGGGRRSGGAGGARSAGGKGGGAGKGRIRRSQGK